MNDIVFSLFFTDKVGKPDLPAKPSSFQPYLRGVSDSAALVSIPQITPEMYHQLIKLRSKTKDLKLECANLRNMARQQSLSTRESLKETCNKIKVSLSLMCDSSLNDPVERRLRMDRLRLSRDEDTYRTDVRRLDKDLTDLESSVEELRSNVINRRCRVNMSDVENMAHILSRASKTVADLKIRYPHLQDSLKNVMQAEMEIVVREEKFLKEEPEKLEQALRRCKKLTGTLVTLKRLASVQEQRSTAGVSPQSSKDMSSSPITVSPNSRSDQQQVQPQQSSPLTSKHHQQHHSPSSQQQSHYAQGSRSQSGSVGEKSKQESAQALRVSTNYTLLENQSMQCLFIADDVTDAQLICSLSLII
jgi:hypothetical protein